MKRFKRAGFLTTLVVLTLLVVASVSLLNLRTRIAEAQTTLETLQAQVDEQTQYNAALREDIENSDDPDVVLEVAKKRLGLVNADEVIFYDTSN